MPRAKPGPASRGLLERLRTPVVFAWQRDGAARLELPSWVAVPAVLAVVGALLGVWDSTLTALPPWLVPVVGGVPVSPAVPAALVVFAVGVAKGARWPGPSRLWRGWAVLGSGLLAGAVACWVAGTGGDPAGAAAVALGAAGEEGVYRLAVPWLVARGLARRWPDGAVWIGIGLSSLSFAFLPGHVDQFAVASGGPVVFGLFGLFTCLLTWELANPLPAFVVHLTLDLSALVAGTAGWRHTTVVALIAATAGSASAALVATLWRRSPPVDAGRPRSRRGWASHPDADRSGR